MCASDDFCYPHLSQIADLIIKSLQFDPSGEPSPSISPADRLRNWEDNLSLQKINIARNMLTESSVPPTRDVLTRCNTLTEVDLTTLPLDKYVLLCLSFCVNFASFSAATKLRLWSR